MKTKEICLNLHDSGEIFVILQPVLETAYRREQNQVDLSLAEREGVRRSQTKNKT